MMKRRKKNPKRAMPPALKRYWAARNRRLRNPRGGKFDRCVKAVKKSGSAKNPYAVCRTAVRGTNPRLPTQHVLLAQRKGGPVLKYLGGVKFARTGHAARFPTKQAAQSVGRSLQRDFRVLKAYTVWAT